MCDDSQRRAVARSAKGLGLTPGFLLGGFSCNLATLEFFSVGLLEWLAELWVHFSDGLRGDIGFSLFSGFSAFFAGVNSSLGTLFVTILIAVVLSVDEVVSEGEESEGS